MCFYVKIPINFWRGVRHPPVSNIFHFRCRVSRLAIRKMMASLSVVAAFSLTHTHPLQYHSRFTSSTLFVEKLISYSCASLFAYIFSFYSSGNICSPLPKASSSVAKFVFFIFRLVTYFIVFVLCPLTLYGLHDQQNNNSVAEFNVSAFAFYLRAANKMSRPGRLFKCFISLHVR